MIVFGVLGTAMITPRALVGPCVDEPGARIRSIAARDRGRAEEFARWHGIPRVLDSYDDVVADDRADAIYIPLPIAMHHRWTIEALRAGKHVLCEKSMAANSTQAAEMAGVAADTGLILMDAFHCRYHSAFVRAKEIYDSGLLGTINRISGQFHVPVPDLGNIRHDYALGGGVTLDIGSYPISWARHLTGEEPRVLSATAEVGQPNVDTFLEAQFVFPSGVEATVSGDMRPSARFSAQLTVTGDAGTMTFDNPALPQLGHRITVTVGQDTTVEITDRRASYGYQLDAFLAAVEHGRPPLTDARDGLNQVAAIDACYDAAGLPRRGLDL